MRRFYTLLLFALWLPLFSFAQSNFKPGYIVKLNGDTLHGLIDYREWGRNPKQINFKTDLNSSNAQEYTNRTIIAFAIRGLEYYQRFNVSISQDQVDQSRLANKLDTTTITEAVFLRLLTKGKYVSLYNYTDEIKSRNYVLETGTITPQELTYHVYYSQGDVASIKYLNKFRGQLQYIIQKNGIDNKKLSNQIANCIYSSSELTRVAQNINGNYSQAVASEKLSGVRWFAGVSADYNSLKFSGESQLSDASASNKVAPQLNAGVDLLVNKNIQKFYLRGELSVNYVQYSLTGANTEIPFATTNQLNFKQTNIILTPQAVYNFYNTANFKVFIDVGVSLHYSLYNKYQFVTNYDGSPSIARDNYPKFETVWFAIPLRAGIEINKRVQVNVCFIPSTSMTQYQSFAGDVSSFQAGVNYLFGSK